MSDLAYYTPRARRNDFAAQLARQVGGAAVNYARTRANSWAADGGPQRAANAAATYAGNVARQLFKGRGKRAAAVKAKRSVDSNLVSNLVRAELPGNVSTLPSVTILKEMKSSEASIMYGKMNPGIDVKFDLKQIVATSPVGRCAWYSRMCLVPQSRLLTGDLINTNTLTGNGASAYLPGQLGLGDLMHMADQAQLITNIGTTARGNYVLNRSVMTKYSEEHTFRNMSIVDAFIEVHILKPKRHHHSVRHDLIAVSNQAYLAEQSKVTASIRTQYDDVSYDPMDRELFKAQINRLHKVKFIIPAGETRTIKVYMPTQVIKPEDNVDGDIAATTFSADSQGLLWAPQTYTVCVKAYGASVWDTNLNAMIPSPVEVSWIGQLRCHMLPTMIPVKQNECSYC
jgi:hypothetical protein